MKLLYLRFLSCTVIRFNAREVGIYVANEVLKTQFLDKPVAQFETVRPPFDLFEFSAPKIVEFALPGGLYYYKSKLPDSYPVLSPTNSLRSLTTRCVHPENVFVVKVLCDIFSFELKILSYKTYFL